MALGCDPTWLAANASLSHNKSINYPFPPFKRKKVTIDQKSPTPADDDGVG